MAGIIVLHSGDWDISGSGFRDMVDGVSKYLPDDDLGLSVKNELSVAVESQLYFIDLTKSFSTDMINVFKSALKKHVDEVENEDPQTWENPSLYKGYLGRLDELCKRLPD